MYLAIIKSFLFGMTVGLAVGPIGLLILYTGMNKGFRVASFCALGASLGDFTFALIAFFASANLLRPIVNDKAVIILVSSWVLILFGLYMIVKAIIKPRKKGDLMQKPELVHKTQSKRYLSSTYLLTLANPLTIILFIGFAGQNVGHISILQGIVFSTALFVGNIIIQFTLVLVGKIFGKLLRRFQLSRYLTIASGIIVMLFGVAHLI